MAKAKKTETESVLSKSDAKRRETIKKSKKAPKVERVLTLGKYLRELRLKANISQTFVAKKLGLIAYQFVYHMETEKAIPPLKHVKVMAKLYGVEDKEIRAEIVRFLIAQIKMKYGFKA